MTWTQRAKDIVTDKGLSEIDDMNLLVSLANDLAQTLPDPRKDDSVSSRQVRIILAESVAASSRIQRGRSLGSKGDKDADARKEASLMKIALVYAIGREKNNDSVKRKLQDLSACVNVLLESVKTYEDFKVMRKFSEAVMAYFKFHGGK